MTGAVKKRNVVSPNKNVRAVSYVTYWKKMLLRDLRIKQVGINNQNRKDGIADVVTPKAERNTTTSSSA